MDCNRGATTAEKLRGTKVWIPTAPRLAKSRAGCWVREGVAPPALRVRGITPRKLAKTHMLNPAFCRWLLCLLVGSLGREISCFLKTTAKKLGGTNTLLVPNVKVGDQSPPVPTVAVPMNWKAISLEGIPAIVMECRFAQQPMILRKWSHFGPRLNNFYGEQNSKCTGKRPQQVSQTSWDHPALYIGYVMHYGVHEKCGQPRDSAKFWGSWSLGPLYKGHWQWHEHISTSG